MKLTHTVKHDQPEKRTAKPSSSWNSTASILIGQSQHWALYSERELPGADFNQAFRRFRDAMRRRGIKIETRVVDRNLWVRVTSEPPLLDPRRPYWYPCRARRSTNA